MILQMCEFAVMSPHFTKLTVQISQHCLLYVFDTPVLYYHNYYVYKIEYAILQIPSLDQLLY